VRLEFHARQITAEVIPDSTCSQGNRTYHGDRSPQPSHGAWRWGVLFSYVLLLGALLLGVFLPDVPRLDVLLLGVLLTGLRIRCGLIRPKARTELLSANSHLNTGYF